MYSYNYLFLQIFINSFSISINQFIKSVHPFGTTAGVIRVNGSQWKTIFNSWSLSKSLGHKECLLSLETLTQ